MEQVVRNTGLIGFPTSHSLSPVIHGYWLKKHHIAGDYKLFTTPPARLRQTMLHMRKKNVLGVNITVPHKLAVMEYLDERDALAKRIGAVNTVINKNGKFIGTNTDAYGFITNLRQGLGDLKPYLEQVMILGAGGATRAAIVALQDAGAKHIILCNRTWEKAQVMAREFHVHHAKWEERHELSNISLLVNTTSLGMDHNDPLIIDLSNLSKTAAVHDIVYAPLETELLTQAKSRGLAPIDGLGMLLYQAQLAFQHWHGVLPEVSDELRALVLEARA